MTDHRITPRQISHMEAREIAQRLINSHFHKEPCARVSIPARPDYDDDLLILSYIKQQSAKETTHDLLNRLDNWEQGTASACAKAMIKTADDMRKERDEAREAVRRLAGALERIEGGCASIYAHETATEALADPVVRRIIES